MTSFVSLSTSSRAPRGQNLCLEDNKEDQCLSLSLSSKWKGVIKTNENNPIISWWFHCRPEPLIRFLINLKILYEVVPWNRKLLRLVHPFWPRLGFCPSKSLRPFASLLVSTQEEVRWNILFKDGHLNSELMKKKINSWIESLNSLEWLAFWCHHPLGPGPNQVTRNKVPVQSTLTVRLIRLISNCRNSKLTLMRTCFMD